MRFLSRPDYQPLKQRPLARALNVPDDQYSLFTDALKDLRQNGKIVIASKSTITLPQISNRIIGTFESSSRGFGFVRPEKLIAQGDLFIPPGDSLDAISGDRVVARVQQQGKREGKDRYVGRIVEVLERSVTQVTGTLTRQGKQWFVQPDGRALSEAVAVDDPSAKDAKLGDKVLVEILNYPSAEFFANGVIIERLGKSGTSAAELLAVMRRFGFEENFSRTALNNARNAIKNFDPESAIKSKLREDARNQTVITIDPADARDFDDAISLRKLPNDQWLLGVHIADASHFVTTQTHLDDEAQHRGNSVYLPRKVIPMLPEILSNGLCSLQENQNRFVKSAYIKLDNRANVLETRFANSVISSAKRLTYEQVDAILEGKSADQPPTIVKLIKKMETLAQIILKRRQKNGMLTLEIPKAELIYDQKGLVIDAQPESTSFSHTIIEMFMLEANEAVARLLDSLNVPFLRRIHPEPDSLATGETARIIKTCGYLIPKNIDRQSLQQLLLKVQGKPESFLINLAVLKSMQRAEYSPSPQGHYALASTHYCHFTSPIRRYPDLTIHRLLQAYLDGSLTKSTTSDFPDFDQLDQLGKQCSTTERNAEKAEDQLRKIKILQLLSKRLGQNTLAVVTSITNFGLFVQLEKFLIEGLIAEKDVPRSLSRKKSSKPARSSRSAGRQKFPDICPFKLGQEINVQIAAVNPAAGTLDLIPSPNNKKST
ncbi:MAG: ribonuclease R [Sedimentisphaerales bacterium]|nr:ribonuclease R [Sedimentisphaerales bacterium]